MRAGIVAIVLLSLTTSYARAAQICAWLVESDAPGHTRNLDLWLATDSSVRFVYDVGGRGLVSSAGEMNAPQSGTYAFEPGEERKVWSYSTTFYPPGKIEVTLDIHNAPIDPSSSAPTPLLAKFKFAREIPDSETSPPDTLGKKQCMELMSVALPF